MQLPFYVRPQLRERVSLIERHPPMSISRSPVVLMVWQLVASWQEATSFLAQACIDRLLLIRTQYGPIEAFEVAVPAVMATCRRMIRQALPHN